MSTGLTYSMVLNVTQTWDSVKRSKEYDNLVKLMFERLFEDAPSTRAVFGLKPTDVFSEEWESNNRFVQHARRIVDMIDCAVNFLGPDFEAMEEILLDLGGRHVAYGARAEYFAVMGNAFVVALGKILKSAFTDELRKDWNQVFGFMAEKMADGMAQQH